MLIAPIDARRVATRLRSIFTLRSVHPSQSHRGSLKALQGARHRFRSLADHDLRLPALPSLGLRHRRPGAAVLASERTLPVLVASLVLIAGVFSAGTGLISSGPIGGPGGEDGETPRIAIAGLAGAPGQGSSSGASARWNDLGDPYDDLATFAAVIVNEAIEGPFLEDGTILKPVAVDTSVQDATGLMRHHTIRSGDTLTGIANRYGVSMMTIWWANDINSKDSLKVGQELLIPPTDGLVVTVAVGDTLESLAAGNAVDAQRIVEVNQLEDQTLIVGQVLVMPGARGEAIPTPPPTPKPTPRPRATTGGGGGGAGAGGGTVSGPSTYSGGRFVWPVVGGNNYVSQYYRYGHYGVDIAATHGSTVRAAASGTVTFSGWRGNGGGYQVWISHGSGLHTTYSHMSGVTVGRGQHVGQGQQVGRVGATGRATGPHLHFEAWNGQPWSGGNRTNPLRYL